MSEAQVTEQAARRWLHLRVTADHESVEPVAELFSRYGYGGGVVIQEPFTQDPDGENFAIDPTRPVEVSTYLPVDERLPETLHEIEQGLWYLGRIGQVGQLETREQEEEDWANAWKEHFHVLRIGRRFVVRPSWREYQPQPGDVVIDLDPGMAFGTGLHPTTELCLRWLEELPVDGARVLDAGAGSGILSIAAAKLGAAAIDAIEIDPVAVRALQHNIDLNGLGDRITARLGDVTAPMAVERPYDIVLANILSRILVRAADTLAALTRPGGTLVLSGVIEAHEPEVVETFARAGFEFRDRRVGGDWVALLAERRA